MARNKVLISYTTGENLRIPDFYDYLNLLIKPEGSLMLPSHDRSPAAGRNALIEAAQQHDCSHILFIDDDNMFEPDALIKLLEHDVDIVSGLYLNKPYPHSPVVFEIADDNGSAFPFFLMPYDGIRLKPMVASGFGFLLCKLTVFDKLKKPYVRLGELDPTQWCDDIGFFKRVREAGIQSYCDFDVWIGHMGKMIVKPYRNDKGEWFTTYDTGGSGAINTPQIQPIPQYAFKDE